MTFAKFNVAAAALVTATAAYAMNPEVGGAPLLDTRHLVDTAVNSADHETLVAAVVAADLAGTLSGDGPFTVFAPPDDAFAALPEGTVATLLKPENKDQLVKVLACHVVAVGAMSGALAKLITDDGGSHAVATVGGCTLQATMKGEMIMLEDEQGRMATVTIADVKQSNGVIHVVDSVLLPKG